MTKNTESTDTEGEVKSKGLRWMKQAVVQSLTVVSSTLSGYKIN